MNTIKTDVVIVGASLAGCTSAILLARQGLAVTLVEREPDLGAFKKVCTHLIQSPAVGSLARREKEFGWRHQNNVGYSNGGPFDAVRKLVFSSTPLDSTLRRLVFENEAGRVDPRWGGLKILGRAAWVQATRWARKVDLPHPTPAAYGA